jgi:P4 family phage/plasmid primase-like protien
MSIDLEQLKQRNDLVDVLRELTSWTFRGRGNTLNTNEHESFMVFLDTQTWKWFSPKGEQITRGRTQGDVITAVEVFRNCDFMAACEWLAERAGIELAPMTPEQAAAHQRKRQERDALTAVAEWLHQGLWQDEAALAWVHGRGWTDEQIKAEQVGYWPGQQAFGELVRWLALRDVDANLPVVAMWRDDWPPQMVVYTHWLNGRVNYVTGRSIEDEAGRTWTNAAGQEVTRPKSYNPKVVRLGERQPYFNAAYNRGAAHVVLCEGQADAISWGVWGVAAVASCGLSSKAWLEVVRMLGERHQFLYLNIDEEEANSPAHAGVLRAATAVAEAAPLVSVVVLNHHDANDALVAGVTAEEAQERLAESVPFAVFYAGEVATAEPLARRGMTLTAVEQAARLRVASERTYAQYRPMLASMLAGGSVTTLDKTVKAVEVVTAEPAPLADKEEMAAPRVSLGGAPPDDVMLRGALRSEPADHEGHAQCVLRCFPNQLLFVPEWGWLAWTGTHWAREGAEALAKRKITQVLRWRQWVAEEGGLDTLAQASPANSYTVTGTLSQLQSIVTTNTDSFNAHPDHINVKNGVVSLQTGEIAPHSPEWRFMWCVDAALNLEKAYEGEWHEFVWASVWNGDEEDSTAVLHWLQRALGYSLTGHTTEELFLYLHGPTRSGKGTLTQTMLDLVGNPFGREVKMDVFYNSGNTDTNNFHLAPLKDARLVVASETNRHQRLDPALIKLVSGGDKMYVSFKRREHFDFKPQFQVLMSSNWPLNMDSDDDAAWETRVAVVPFPNSNKGKEDKGLKARLLAQRENVLAWLVMGAMYWYANDRRLPEQAPSMLTARDKMRHEQDLVGIWLGEMFDVVDPADDGAFTPLELLTKAYQAWCKENGLRAKGRASLLQTLETKGFNKAKRRHTMYKNPRAGIVGLRLAGIDEVAEQADIAL